MRGGKRRWTGVRDGRTGGNVYMEGSFHTGRKRREAKHCIALGRLTEKRQKSNTHRSEDRAG